MAKASGTAEPSMEEILASIRRIISDETPSAEAAVAIKSIPPSPAPAAAPAAASGGNFSQDDLDKLFAGDDPEPEPAEEVLELSEAAIVPEEEPLQLVEGLPPDEADVQFVDPAEFEEPAPVVAPPVAVAPPPPPPRPAAKAQPKPVPPPEPVEVEDEETEEPLVSAHAGASVNAAFGQLTHTILSAKAKTLDDLVKEMLRPMLKGWLDENLPVIVERLVRAEIERVSRGR